MSRYIREEFINKPEAFVDFIMADFLKKHGFKLSVVKGETVFQDGSGMISIPRYFKYYYNNGVIHLEAWTKILWFPGIYGRENDLSGYMGCVPKKAYRNDIENLIQVLYQPLPSDSPYGTAYGQPGMNQGYGGYYNAQGYPNGGYHNPQGYPGTPVTPVTVKGVDTKNLVNVGFWFSILSIPLVVFNTWCGLVVSMIGTFYSYKSLGSTKKGLATAGFVIGLIALLVSLAALFFGIGSILLD